MSRIWIHAGPPKTGTTAFQEAMWAARAALLRQGVLYPVTGIEAARWGHRHLRLAERFDPDLWAALEAEIAASGAGRVVLSAERFFRAGATLRAAAPILRRHDAHLLLVVRRESDLVRSAYLQSVKSHFLQFRQGGRALQHFELWWHKRRDDFVYARMLAPWLELFGASRVTLVPYDGGDIVARLCAAMDLPPLDAAPDGAGHRNPSIGVHAAAMALGWGQWGRLAGQAGLRLGMRAEARDRALAAGPLPGFDAAEIDGWYQAQNAALAQDLPALAAAIRQVHGAAPPLG